MWLESYLTDREESLSCGWRALSLSLTWSGVTGRSRCRVVGEPSHLPGAGVTGRSRCRVVGELCLSH